MPPTCLHNCHKPYYNELMDHAVLGADLSQSELSEMVRKTSLTDHKRDIQGKFYIPFVVASYRRHNYIYTIYVL